MRAMAADDLDLPWYTARTKCKLTPGARGIKAVDIHGKIWGMVVYDCFTRNGAQVHVALDSPWAARCLLRMAFTYPFVECGFQVLMGLVPALHRKSLVLAKALGFRETHRVCDGWAPGVDLVLLEMRRDECRYLSTMPTHAARRDQLRRLRLVGGR